MSDNTTIDVMGTIRRLEAEIEDLRAQIAAMRVDAQLGIALRNSVAGKPYDLPHNRCWVMEVFDALSQAKEKLAPTERDNE